MMYKKVAVVVETAVNQKILFPDQLLINPLSAVKAEVVLNLARNWERPAPLSLPSGSLSTALLLGLPWPCLSDSVFVAERPRWAWGSSSWLPASWPGPSISR